MTILAEEGLARLKCVTPKTVTTPCGTYDGLAAPASDSICGVDIVRSGGILLEAVRKIAPDSEAPPSDQTARPTAHSSSLVNASLIRALSG
jgi:uracil phosphoribosyltransferase